LKKQRETDKTEMCERMRVLEREVQYMRDVQQNVTVEQWVDNDASLEMTETNSAEHRSTDLPPVFNRDSDHGKEQQTVSDDNRHTDHVESTEGTPGLAIELTYSTDNTPFKDQSSGLRGDQQTGPTTRESADRPRSLRGHAQLGWTEELYLENIQRDSDDDSDDYLAEAVKRHGFKHGMVIRPVRLIKNRFCDEVVGCRSEWPALMSRGH
jgi:hypothetical protein